MSLIGLMYISRCINKFHYLLLCVKDIFSFQLTKSCFIQFTFYLKGLRCKVNNCKQNAFSSYVNGFHFEIQIKLWCSVNELNIIKFSPFCKDKINFLLLSSNENLSDFCYKKSLKAFLHFEMQKISDSLNWFSFEKFSINYNHVWRARHLRRRGFRSHLKTHANN